MKHYKLPSISTIPETIILANGEFPTHEIPLSILHNAKNIVCCDGAVDQLMNNDITNPNAIVGDCDSLTEQNRELFSHIIHRISEQETNDLTKSVNFCIDNNRKDIIILGATGKREDHTLGNISLLADYINIEGLNVEMITDYGIFTAIDENTEFECYKGQQISIFDLEHSPITSCGLKYPIRNRILTNWWQGTLNEAESDLFSIKTSGKLIIFRAF